MALDPCGLLPTEWLNEFAAHQSNDDHADAVAQHLGECSRCREYVSEKHAEEGLDEKIVLDLSLQVSHPNLVTTAKSDSFEPSPKYNPEHWAELDLLDPPTADGAIGGLMKYDVLEVRGRGGMGVVLKGYDRQLKRVVAIKLMSRRLMQSDKSLKRFEREAILAASINHPNVVTIHGVESHRGFPFIVMEYVEGQSLAQRISDRGKLSVVETVRLSSQIASGLAAAHSRGVIHRDIKPANIMLEDGIERVKITDFGLARIAQENSDLTSLGEAIGTPLYMSPEQVEGVELTTATDVFSLGCVMHAMLTGRSPFVGGHQLKVVQRIVNEQPTPLDKIDPAIPQSLASMVTRMLEKDPRARTISASDIAARLHSDLLTMMQSESGLVTVSIQPPAAKRRPISQVVTFAAIVGCVSWLVYSNIIPQPREPLPETESAVVAVEEIPAEEVIPVEPIDYLAERDAAEQVLRLGGSVVIRASQGDQTVTASPDLPTGEFTVAEIDLSSKVAVTDLDLVPFEKLSRLTRLQVQGTSISDQSLATVARFKHLTYLGIGKTNVTDAGVALLNQMERLERLNLQATRITSQGLKPLISLPRLNGLYLNDTQVDDVAIQDIALMKNLKRLEMCRTPLTPTALEQFAAMEKLEELHIAETRTGSPGLAQLAAMKGMNVLNLRGVAVDNSTLEQLRQALPHCRILR